MRYPLRKKNAWFVLLICILLYIGSAQTAYAEEYDYASDENLAIYADNPDFRFENGLAINIQTNAVENGRVDLRTAIIPKGVEEIASVAFTECELLESVVVPEGVRIIGGGAFMGCENLTSITLPTTLEAIYYYAFVDCDFDTLIIPRNTFLDPNLNQSEWYGVLDACKIKTLVFCGTDGLFLPTTFGSIKFPADGSGRIVFWGNPPEFIEVSNLQFNYKGGDVESGTFTICYPAQFADAWAPNGETEWNGLPIRALSWPEEQKLIQKAPKLFSDQDRTDVTEDPGWSFDQYHNVTIYSEEGWYHYCIANWEMEINDLRFAEGVDFILEYFNVDSDEGMYPGPSEIVMKRLLLPSSLTKANLDHMIFQEMIMAEGNRYVAVDNGRLIDPDSGDIIWAPTEPAIEQAAATEEAQLTPTPDSIESQEEQSAPQQAIREPENSVSPATTILLLSAITATAAAAVAATSVLLKRKTTK